MTAPLFVISRPAGNLAIAMGEGLPRGSVHTRPWCMDWTRRMPKASDKDYRGTRLLSMKLSLSKLAATIHGS